MEYRIGKERPTHEELKAATLPLLEILYRYYDPHTSIIITQSDVEVLTGDMCSDMCTPLPLRD